MAGEQAPDEPPAMLPPNRAFVVHVMTRHRQGRRFAGRVEHLASGTSASFGSLHELLSFVERLLDAPPECERVTARWG